MLLGFLPKLSASLQQKAYSSVRGLFYRLDDIAHLRLDSNTKTLHNLTLDMLC